MTIKPIKVAFFMQESRMGGIEYNSVHLAKGLDPQRFHVVFICPGEGKLPELLRQQELRYIFYHRPPLASTSIRFFKGYIFNPFATLYNFLTFFLIIFPVAQMLRREKFQLIVTKGLVANFYGALTGCLANIPCIWDMQEIVSNAKCFGLMRWLLNIWAKLFVRGIVLPAKAVRDQFWETLQGKTVLIPNGIDTDRYHPGIDPAPVRNEFQIQKNQILIGHIARFTYWKGQKDFVLAALEIAEKNSDLRFAVVGAPVFENDSYEQEIIQMVKASGFENRFLFPGFRDDLEKVIAALDIYVHSSTESEGCPITLLTAMSMGKPCVVTNVYGNNEIITSEKQCLLISPGKPLEIADAILSILKNRNLAAELAKQSRERILSAYSLRGYARESAAFFEKITV